MPDGRPGPQEEAEAGRVDRLVRDMLAGRRLKATSRDAAEREAIVTAAALAGAREGFPRMSPGFRRRLAGLLDREAAEGRIDRRSALVAGLGVAVGALGAVAATHLGPLGQPGERSAAEVAPPQPSGRAVVEPRPGRWVDVGINLQELEEGVPRRVSAGAVGAFLIRQGTQVTGLSSICSHLPCELIWKPAGGILNCPCHNQAFNRAGESVDPAYPLPQLPAVLVRVAAGGMLEVFGT